MFNSCIPRLSFGQGYVFQASVHGSQTWCVKVPIESIVHLKTSTLLTHHVMANDSNSCDVTTVVNPVGFPAKCGHPILLRRVLSTVGRVPGMIRMITANFISTGVTRFIGMVGCPKTGRSIEFPQKRIVKN